LESAPLTFAQEHQYYSDDHKYRSGCFSFRIGGPVDVAALIASLGELVRRHDALRLRFVESADREPCQTVVGAGHDLKVPVSCEHVNARSEAQFERYVKQKLRADMLSGWDLEEQDPFRFRILRYHDQAHALIGCFPGIAVDNLGGRMLSRRLKTLYRTPGDPYSAPSFIEAAREQRRRYDARSVVANAEYWRRLFSDRTERMVPIPAQPDGGNPQHPGSSDLEIEWRLTGDRHTHFVNLCRVLRVSTEVLLLAIYISTVFENAGFQKLAMTRGVNTRGSTARDVVGSFASATPMVFDRQLLAEKGIGYIRQANFDSTIHCHVGHETVRHFWSQFDAQASGVVMPAPLYFTYMDRRQEEPSTFPGGSWVDGAYDPKIAVDPESAGLFVTEHGDYIVVALQLGAETPMDVGAVAERFAVALDQIGSNSGLRL
jgi:hypothetical protein